MLTAPTAPPPPTAAPAVVQVTAGVDTPSHVQPTHNKVADALGQLYNIQVAPESVQPVSTQHPITPEVAQVASKPVHEYDLQEILDGWKGKPRTEPSKNFLSILKDRLRKQSPDQDLQSS